MPELDIGMASYVVQISFTDENDELGAVEEQTDRIMHHFKYMLHAAGFGCSVISASRKENL